MNSFRLVNPVLLFLLFWPLINLFDSDTAAKQPDIRLGNFISQVSNGHADEVRGIYASGLFALPVVQQPRHNAIFVSNKRERVTQFAPAAEHNIIGLLAHNYLSGKKFYELTPRQDVVVVYGDRAVKHYQVTKIYHYRKVNPAQLRSDLIDLATGENLSMAAVYGQFYRGRHRLVFQTCLETGGQLNGGLTFIVAEPIETSPTYFSPETPQFDALSL